MFDWHYNYFLYFSLKWYTEKPLAMALWTSKTYFSGELILLE